MKISTLKSRTAFVSAVLFTAVAILFVGCNKNDEEKPEEKGQLLITIKGSDTRATGATLPGNEAKIERIAVGIFNSDGSVNVITEPSLADLKATVTCDPGTDCEVVVVANATAGLFTGVTSKADFLAKTVNLTGSQDFNKLPMSGISAKTTIVANVTTPVSVELVRLVSRISISSLKTQLAAGVSFTLEKVFLYNALGTSKVGLGDITTTQPVTKTWLGGMKESGATWVTDQALLLEELASPVKLEGTSAEHTTSYWFYAFANNDPDHQTALVLSGTFKYVDGMTKTTYYPIIINRGNVEVDGVAAVGDGTIARNNEYKIAATIKAEGVDDPETELFDTRVELTASIADWKSEFVQEVIMD